MVIVSRRRWWIYLINVMGVEGGGRGGGRSLTLGLDGYLRHLSVAFYG